MTVMALELRAVSGQKTLHILSVPWHHMLMPRRSSKDRDFAVTARKVVEKAIGQTLDGEPLQQDQEVDTGKNVHAVALGRLGGQIGGKARAKALSKRERHRIAVMAAKARWHRN